MTTAYYSHADCRRHDMGRGHPECPQRLDAIDDHLLAHGLNDALDRREAPRAALSDLGLAHSSGYVDELRDFLDRVCDSGESRALDPDTIASPGTRDAVMRAAGAAVAATDAVLDGEVENAFCAVRPPGHHATRDAAMGFCFFNNVAVAARHALDVRGLERVAIVDFDVHHGNGTEDIIAGDERVLMVSIFQHPFYPGSGAVPARRQHGQPADSGLYPRRRDPQADRCPLDAAPGGVPAADDLHLGRLRRPPRGRPRPARTRRGRLRMDDPSASRPWPLRHAGGRIVSCLEGGYNLGALARSVAAHLRVLAGV